jgi:hypothetical protein
MTRIYSRHLVVPTSSAALRRLILTEIAARTFAARLRMLFRAEMRQSKVPGQARYKELLIDYLNSLIRSIQCGYLASDFMRPDDGNVSSDAVALFSLPDFWTVTAKYYVNKKFPEALSAEELAPTFLMHVCWQST